MSEKPNTEFLQVMGFAPDQHDHLLSDAPLTAEFLSTHRAALLGDPKFEGIRDTLVNRLHDPGFAAHFENHVMNNPVAAAEMNRVMTSRDPDALAMVATMFSPPTQAEAAPPSYTVPIAQGGVATVTQLDGFDRIELPSRKAQSGGPFEAPSIEPLLNFLDRTGPASAFAALSPAVMTEEIQPKPQNDPSPQALKMAEYIMQNPGSKAEVLGANGQMRERAEFMKTDPDADPRMVQASIAQRLDEMMHEAGKSGGALKVAGAKGETAFLEQGVDDSDNRFARIAPNADEAVTFTAGNPPTEAPSTQPNLEVSTTQVSAARRPATRGMGM
jgi:hypothetical protein